MVACQRTLHAIVSSFKIYSFCLSDIVTDPCLPVAGMSNIQYMSYTQTHLSQIFFFYIFSEYYVDETVEELKVSISEPNSFLKKFERNFSFEKWKYCLQKNPQIFQRKLPSFQQSY